ncbi:glycosyltransferase [Roseofilum capinflatum]|uniref:Glycosyltransferase n=1 Tax=Roseofilum capinflatum BLCC-M114 TaxID=3022440 RepID=A0ABT7BAQ7_9CYAN|nr:glycosyltransferase [Roseofilum capinflatum]MDJ1175388.1 glycosyltransferase [Roseofilum capinflatum BLCC-M114]
MYQSKSASSCHLWFPNMFGFKGGIQVYSAFLLKALQNFYHDVHYQVYLKHDSQSSPDLGDWHQTDFHFTGKIPLSLRTPAFAAQIMLGGLWHSPELVITSHLNFTPIAYWLKQLRGIPYWTIAHGVEAWNIERPLLKTALGHADRILAVSHYTRDRLLKEQDLNPEQVLLLPNTFDSDRFTIAPKPPYLLQRYGFSPETKILLTVCRLDSQEQYKGYDRILEALPTILPQVPNLHYLIVGKGDDRPRVETLIQQLNLQKYVTLAGFIPDEELCDHYNTIPLGVDIPEIQPDAKAKLRAKYDIPLDATIILFLSRLHYKKRPDLLIEALHQVQSKRPNLYLLLAGSGDSEYIEQLKQLLHQLDLHHCTRFTGFVTGEDKDLVLQGSDLFVLPSFSENFGIAVVEAMAAGLPVIITPEVQIAPEIKQANAGLIVEGNRESVASAIAQLLTSEKQKLSHNAQTLVKQCYSWPAIAERLADVDCSLIQNQLND